MGRRGGRAPSGILDSNNDTLGAGVAGGGGGGGGGKGSGGKGAFK